MRRAGDAVDGGLAYGCNESFQVESAVTGGPVFRTRLFAAKLRVAEGAVGDEKADSRQAGCATPRFTMPARIAPKGSCGTCGGALAGQIHGVTGAQSPSERAEEEQHTSCRTKALWTGKSFVASRRRGGSGLGESLRIGPTCTAKGTHRYRGRIATGASEVGRRVHGSVEQTP
jgi:hypothetical protein